MTLLHIFQYHAIPLSPIRGGKSYTRFAGRTKVNKICVKLKGLCLKWEHKKYKKIAGCWIKKVVFRLRKMSKKHSTSKYFFVEWWYISINERKTIFLFLNPNYRSLKQFFSQFVWAILETKCHFSFKKLSSNETFLNVIF